MHGGRPRSLRVRPRTADWRTQERDFAKPHLHPVVHFTYINTVPWGGKVACCTYTITYTKLHLAALWNLGCCSPLPNALPTYGTPTLLHPPTQSMIDIVEKQNLAQSGFS